MAARSGAGRCIMGHRVFEEVTLLVYQRMHISHEGNLLMGCHIRDEGLENVVYR